MDPASRCFTRKMHEIWCEDVCVKYVMSMMMMCVNAYHKETFVLRKLSSRNTLDFHLVEQQIEIVLDGDDPGRKTVEDSIRIFW